MNLKNTALVSHANCSDGSTCAILFIAAGGSRDLVYFSSPDHRIVEATVEKIWRDHPTKSLILADVSVSEEFAMRIEKEGRDVKIFDHHQSAAGLATFDFCEIDNCRCGCQILFDWLQKQPQVKSTVRYQDLVCLVDDRDRWANKYPEALDISNLFYCLKTKKIMDRFLENPSVKLDEKEQYLIDINRDNNKDYIADKIKEARIIDKLIDGKNCRIALVEAGSNQSELGHALCESLEADIAMMINGRSVSLRAAYNTDFDLSIISAYNKGGGHKKSSGTSIRNVLGKDLVDIVLDKFKWD